MAVVGLLELRKVENANSNWPTRLGNYYWQFRRRARRFNGIESIQVVV